MAMNVTAPTSTKWRAEITERRIYVRRKEETTEGETKMTSRPLNLLYVVLERAEGDSISFCVTRPKGRITLSDSRECFTGAAGTTGLWDTRPASQPGKRRTLTPTAWIAEVSRLIGTKRAVEIIDSLREATPPF
jgi:hypothetical protein